MSIRRMIISLVPLAPLALLVGCALDPIEEQQEKLDSQELFERREAVEFLKGYDDDRTIELLVETLEGDPELLEEAGNALVLKGREWEADHPNAKKSEQNPVIEQLSQTVADMHLEAPVRTKACWVLGEIGSRRAIPALKGRTGDPSSMKVRAEATNSLKKLGYTADTMPREMLGDGRFVETYTPEEREARGLVIKEEGEEETSGAEKTTNDEKA
ncbi:MAG: HEAT repeat domain-containing protein [Candidatus Zipacnadales bacterium]